MTKPDDVAAILERAAGLHGRADFAQAEPLYRAILARVPGHFDAMHLLGALCHQTGRQEEAVRLMRQALAIDPSQASVHSNLGHALVASGALDDAIASFERAGAISPGDPGAPFHRGLALLARGRAAEALESFDRTLVLKPGDPAVLCNRGNALQALKRHAEALACYDAAIAAAPGLAEAFSNRGNALRDLGRSGEAVQSFDKALALNPAFPGALNGRGIALRDLGRSEEALRSYERAIALDPAFADAMCNQGNVLQDLGRYDEAMRCYGSARAAVPDHAASQWNESLCRLLLGDFERGWSQYEWRWKTEQLNAVRDFPQPRWTGKEDLTGKTVLLHAEQGFGDTLHFCRYAGKVASRGARVVFEVQAPLKTLAESLEGVSKVVARGEPLPRFDFHCPLVSLPLAFGTRLETIPWDGAYLRSDPVRVDRWRNRLGPASLPRVGLVWSGSGGLRNDVARGIPLSKFASLASGKGQFISLQKQLSDSDRLLIERGGIIRTCDEYLVDFAETAALVELMDVVVTIDTAVAHLAGAMGKRVWILLPHAPTWRWLLGREDSPWYPTARLFRDAKEGGWDSALKRARRELDRLT